MALWVGPRKAVQSCVTAPVDSGLGFERMRLCAQTTAVPSRFVNSASRIARREMSDIGRSSYIQSRAEASFGLKAPEADPKRNHDRLRLENRGRRRPLQ